jgi:hypothetical protein
VASKTLACAISILLIRVLLPPNVGRQAPPPAEDAESEMSEWEFRERRGREEERRVEAEELGAGVEEPLFLPTPAFMASAEEE